MSVIQAIVPVAGLGTRMLPLSQAVPKELLPLGSKPTLHWVAEELGRAGVRHVSLVTSEAKRNIGRYFETNSEIVSRIKNKPELAAKLWCNSDWNSMQFQTVIQAEQLGLGHAVLCGRDGLRPGPFVLALGDCVMGLGGESSTTARIVDVFTSNNADAVIAFQKVPVDLVSRYGIATLGAELDLGEAGRVAFHLQGIVEKPHRDCAPSQFAVSARYVFSDSIFPILEQARKDSSGEVQLTSAIQHLIEQGGKVIGVTLLEGEERFDVGDYDSWAAGFIRFAMHENPALSKLSRETGQPGANQA